MEELSKEILNEVQFLSPLSWYSAKKTHTRPVFVDALNRNKSDHFKLNVMPMCVK